MIQSEIEREDNRVCGECYAPDPLYLSLNLGVFICKKCFNFHKKLNIDRNNAVAFRTHQFTDDQLAFIRSRGNKVVAENFEKYLPKYYHRPKPQDPPLIREQFIKAKYGREEFKDISKQEGYSLGSKTGSLFKKGKDNDRFLRRKFVLKEPEGVLEYFIKFSDRVPKDSIIVRNLVNIYLAPEKMGNPNGMQITYEKEGTRRNLYVFGNDGKTTIDWYHAIRASMVKHKYQSFPDDQMKRYLNTKILREGWMSKTGPKRQERFRKRWFSLVGTMIWYYEQPLDAHPISYIPLGSKTFGYGSKKGLPQGVKVDGYGLTIHTPERVYALSCSTIESRDKWITAIDGVLDSCTNSWSSNNQDDEVNGSKNEVEETKHAEDDNNPSSFETLSAKYRPGSGSGSEDSSGTPEPEEAVQKPAKAESNAESTTATESADSQTRTPLFEKKAKPTNHPPKYGGRKASAKRISSTKKVTETEFHRPTGASSDVTDVKETGTSKKYSDDSADDEDDDVVHVIYEEPLTPHSEADIDEVQTNEENMNETANPPQKPPRKQLPSDRIDGSSQGSSQSNSPAKFPTHSDKQGQSSIQTGGESVYDLATDLPHDGTVDDSNRVYATIVLPSNELRSDEKLERVRASFKASVKRLGGQERASVKKNSYATPPPSPGLGFPPDDSKEVNPRPIDVTLVNQMEESFWFMAFQCEEDLDDVESYVTPWVGAKVAEAPASVGAIRIPNEFEIAVIDTAPGGFGLLRTTGPFFAQLGDVWEVEVPKEDGAAPEMYFHEGMETEDGSVMVYSNPANEKKFEIAIYKNGRKLLSRKNVKPGDPVNLRIKPALFFVQVSQSGYYDLQGEDVRASEWVPKSNCVELNYRHSRIKVFSKKRGETVYFTR